MLPREMKWANAVTALNRRFSFPPLASTRFSSGWALSPGSLGMMRTLLVDRFAIYFWYLFLAGTAIAILTSVRYLETEHEINGEYYALMLLSVAGMMCMAAGFDIVLIFIGLELMAISTYVLVGFLAAGPPLQRSSIKIPAARRVLLRHLRLRIVFALWPHRQHNLGVIQQELTRHFFIANTTGRRSRVY